MTKTSQITCEVEDHRSTHANAAERRVGQQTRTEGITNHLRKFLSLQSHDGNQQIDLSLSRLQSNELHKREIAITIQ